MRIDACYYILVCVAYGVKDVTEKDKHEIPYIFDDFDPKRNELHNPTRSYPL